jgi:hypothetical protein
VNPICGNKGRHRAQTHASGTFTEREKARPRHSRDAICAPLRRPRHNTRDVFCESLPSSDVCLRLIDECSSYLSQGVEAHAIPPHPLASSSKRLSASARRGCASACLHATLLRPRSITVLQLQRYGARKYNRLIRGVIARRF